MSECHSVSVVQGGMLKSTNYPASIAVQSILMEHMLAVFGSLG